MKQSILVGPRQSRLEERPIPQVGPSDVLVRVMACGVCASEIDTWRREDSTYPVTLGHEVAGRVVEVGPAVKTIRPGMTVTGLFHGGFAEYAVAPETRVVPLPPNVGYDDSVGEPISCVISAARRTRVELGDTVAIVGLGFMGLLMLQAIRLKGPARIIAVDVREESLKLAKQLGADDALYPEEVGEDLRLTRWEQLGGKCGVDVAIEASGTQAGLTLAGQMVREHGFLSILGYHQGGLRQVDMELWNWKAFDVLNAHERRADYQIDCMRRGLALVSAGKIDTACLISHRFALDQVDAAFAALVSKPAGFRKALIVPNSGD